MSDKLTERVVKAQFVPYTVIVNRRGTDVRKTVRAAKGTKIALLPEDEARLEDLGALESVKSVATQRDSKSADEPFDASTASDKELADYLEAEQPVADDTVALAKGDTEVAKRVLAAESVATGGKPRAGVVAKLEKIIAAGAPT
jgi:hypothetical protein